MRARLVLFVLPYRLSVCRCGAAENVSLPRGGFCSLTRTSEELSVVCEDEFVPAGAASVETGWRALKVEGPLDFSLTGILSSLLNPLAAAEISVFAVSTYDTDYILVREASLADAVELLSRSCEVRQ